MMTTTKTKNYEPSAKHAKRAKVGDKLGTMCYDRESGERQYVDHAYYEVVKVHDDGALTVKTTHSDRRKTLKPDTNKTPSSNRLAWYYTETQPYRSNVYLFIENARDREMQARDEAAYERERRNKAAARRRHLKRETPMYEKLCAMAEAQGKLLESENGSILVFKDPAQHYLDTHRDLDYILSRTDTTHSLANMYLAVPVSTIIKD